MTTINNIIYNALNESSISDSNPQKVNHLIFKTKENKPKNIGIYSSLPDGIRTDKLVKSKINNDPIVKHNNL